MRGALYHCTVPHPRSRSCLWLSQTLPTVLHLFLAPLLFICVAWKFRSFNVCDGNAWAAEVEQCSAPCWLYQGIAHLPGGTQTSAKTLFVVCPQQSLWISVNISLKMSLENTVSMGFSEGLRVNVAIPNISLLGSRRRLGSFWWSQDPRQG